MGDSLAISRISTGPDRSDDALSLAETAEVEMTVEVQVTVEGEPTPIPTVNIESER